MVIFLSAAAIFLFYLCAIPVQFALCVHLSERIGFGLGASAFEPRYAKRGASLRAEGRKKHPPRKKADFDLKKIRRAAPMMKAAGYILRRIRLESFELYGTIATGDAAQTALICGGIEALGYAATFPVTDGRIDIRVRADFSSNYSQLSLNGMISMRIGHIIASALILAASIVKRRFSEWRSTRLKIS